MLKITLDNGKEYFSSGTLDGMNDAISYSLDNNAPFIGFIQTNGKKVVIKINAIEEIIEVERENYSAKLTVKIDTDKLVDDLVLKIADLLKEQSRIGCY